VQTTEQPTEVLLLLLHSLLLSRLTSQDLTEGAFHQLADHTLDDYVEKLETYVESLDMEDDGDVEYSVS
jgi:hypothetical protein